MNLSIINVSVGSFLLCPDETLMYPHVPSCTSWKSYQAETDALNKNVVQYRGEAGLISLVCFEQRETLKMQSFFFFVGPSL